MAQKKLPLINSAHGSDTRNIINELIKLFNGMGYAYNESLQKAQDILDEAQQTNDMNESVQQQINTLIAESGTSDAEVLQARIDAEGNEYNVLKDRLDESDAQLAETEQYLIDKADMGDLYEIRAQRRKGRTFINASELVDLEVGENVDNNNTDALMDLAQRSTKDEEIIVFPSGIIYTDRITLSDDLYWLGDNTVIKLRPQNDKEHYSLGEIRGYEGNLEGITFDGNKDAHVNLTGDCECLDIKNNDSWLMWEVTAKNGQRDGFDHDSSVNNIHVRCVAENHGKDGFHNSSGTNNNQYYYCIAKKTGTQRGGFTSSQNSASANHTFVGCIAIQCVKGFSILESITGNKNNFLVNCFSIENDTEDDLTGMNERSIAPISFNSKGGFEPKTYDEDLNNFPRLTGSFPIGGTSLNLPEINGVSVGSGNLLQSVTLGGRVNQTYFQSGGDYGIFSRTFAGGAGDWVLISTQTNRKSFVIDLNNPPLDVSPAVINCSHASTNLPKSGVPGTLMYTVASSYVVRGMLFIDVNGNVYSRGRPEEAWIKIGGSGNETHSIDLNNPPLDINPKILYCGSGASNRPSIYSGTLIYSVSSGNTVAGMQYIDSQGDMYVRGNTQRPWHKVTTEQIV